MINEFIPDKETFNEDSVERKQCNERNSEKLPSIISIFFDQLNFKGLIKSIFKKTPLKLTDQFIDAVLLLIFLFYLFYSFDVLRFELSWYTSLLIAISIGAFLDFAVNNTPYLMKFFPTDVRTMHFLEKVPTMTKREINEEFKALNFSSKCMNLFLESLKEKNNLYPPYFIDLIINNIVLSKENLNILFSPPILKNIRPEIIIEICLQYRDSLTSENIQNIYNQYKNNERIIKILFATQEDSYFLIQNSDEKKLEINKYNEFYTIYQVDKKHLDRILKIIPISNLRTIRIKFFWFLFFGFIVIYNIGFKTGAIRYPITLEEIIAYIVASFLLAAFIIIVFVKPIFRKIENFYFKRFINNVLKS